MTLSTLQVSAEDWQITAYKFQIKVRDAERQIINLIFEMPKGGIKCLQALQHCLSDNQYQKELCLTKLPERQIVIISGQ